MHKFGLREALIATGLVQGVLLLIGHHVVRSPLLSAAHTPLFLAPWYTLVLVLPATLLIMIGTVERRRLIVFTLALALVLLALSLYAAWGVGGATVEPSTVFIPFVLTVWAGWHITLPLARAALAQGRWHFPYPQLFEYAWNNALTFMIAAIFTSIFAALLGLWAGLFAVVKINFFVDLFSSVYFLYPVLATVFASAVYRARTHVDAVAATRRIVLTIFRALLPMLAVIAVAFLAALPFTGLGLLWETKRATTLLLTLQILMIVYVNAVYQDGNSDTPYAPAVRRLVDAAIVLMPIYSLLSIYALYLRVMQYSWSVDRVWAAILTGLVACYTFGYAFAALRQRGPWLAALTRLNVGAAIGVLIVGVLVNTPLLDARRIAVNSQMHRLLNGKLNADAFDYRYFRFDLARRGNDALARLSQETGHAQAATLRARSTEMLAQTTRWQAPTPVVRSAEDIKAKLDVYPAGHRLDAKFVAFLEQATRHNDDISHCFNDDRRCALLSADLNRDGDEEYILFNCYYASNAAAIVFSRRVDGWSRVGQLQLPGRQCQNGLAPLAALIARGTYRVAHKPWDDLRVGNEWFAFVADVPPKPGAD